MASTLSTSKVAASVPARANLHADWAFATYTITAAFVINDVIQMVKIPKGATVLELIFHTTDLDTSTGIVLQIGDGNDVDRYVKDSTIGQTGGTVRLGSGIVNNSAANYTYTDEDTIDVKITTAASGTAATSGSLSIAVAYTMQS